MRKLFLLEDDLSLISGLTFAFKKQGFALDTARTLAEAEDVYKRQSVSLTLQVPSIQTDYLCLCRKG